MVSQPYPIANSIDPNRDLNQSQSRSCGQNRLKKSMESQSQRTDIDNDTEAPTSSVEKDPSKPLIEEVTFTGTRTTRTVEVLNLGPITTVKANIPALILESMFTFLDLLRGGKKLRSKGVRSLLKVTRIMTFYIIGSKKQKRIWCCCQIIEEFRALTKLSFKKKD
ncbi:hypothetical protein L1887_10970 [Cichorium endivia]|nr:hypothetical protein L1887_10970 [Cichorium endivia]